MCHGYNINAAWRALNVNKKDEITYFDLYDFFASNQHNMSEDELMSIIRRIDTEGDAMINFNEFAEFMRPNVD